MFVIIWTTTPWTLPANLAIAYNSTMNYTSVNVGEETYIVAVSLLDSIAEKCQWSGFQKIRSMYGDELGQLKCEHPFISSRGGAVAGWRRFCGGFHRKRICPYRSLAWFGGLSTGRKHGLPVFSPVDDDGKLCHTTDLPVDQQISQELVGKSVLEKDGKNEANEAVLGS